MAADQLHMQPDTTSRHGLTLRVRPDLMPAFYELLQQGVAVEVRVGSTIQAFLCDRLGLDPLYVEKTIQTIFLNGKAVDDPATALIPDHATVALSAAMPGLLGATLRKGSHYAGMRGEISHREGEKITLHEGKVLLKLFNLLPADIGPQILERGVWVSGKSLKAFFEKRPSLFQGCSCEAGLDGKNVDGETLAEREWLEDDMFLRVLKG